MKSDRFKERANTFNVILRSQNINFGILRNKIEKYTEKFLKLLERVLVGELMNVMPVGLSKVNLSRKNYCKNKHQTILQKFEFSDDDSCFSEIEDEIMKSCQAGIEAKKTPVDNDIIKQPKVDVFIITKEKKAEIVSETTLSKSDSLEEEAYVSNDIGEGVSSFKAFIEVAQNGNKFKPIDFLIKDDNMDIDEPEQKHRKLSLPVKEFQEMLIDPKFDPSSNWNFYRRKFIPQVEKSKERLKDKVPFLRDFNPKFLKKENIDKKILRKFRNYVKSISKESKIILTKFDMKFWKHFSENNLLPPMIYRDNGIEIQFKSFNVNYMVWLFSKNGATELYGYFASKQGNELLNSFIDEYSLTNTTEEGIVEKLKYYIENMHEIFTDKFRKMSMDSFNCSTTQLQSEEILEQYLGDFRDSDNNMFKLGNFEPYNVYPMRCGIDEENDGRFNFDMNCSMDSIQSVE
jgi:hypothetical protein